MSKPLKQRDIPDESRPLAYMNFINTLGTTRMGQKVMIGLGEQYNLGKDHFHLTKQWHFYHKLLISISCIQNDKIKRMIAMDYLNKTEETIIAAKLPFFIEKNFRSLLHSEWRKFKKTLPFNGEPPKSFLNSEQNPERSVATEAQSELPDADKQILQVREVNKLLTEEISKLQSQIKGLVEGLEDILNEAKQCGVITEGFVKMIAKPALTNYYNSNTNTDANG